MEIDEFLEDMRRQLIRHEMGQGMQARKQGIAAYPAEWENIAMSLPVYPSATNLQNPDGSFVFMADFDAADSGPVG